MFKKLILITMLVVFLPNQASALMWAHLKYFEKYENKFLVSKVLNNRAITYCLEISPDAGIDDKFLNVYRLSMHLQIVAALNVWLMAINPYGVYDHNDKKIDLNSINVTWLDSGKDSQCSKGTKGTAFDLLVLVVKDDFRTDTAFYSVEGAPEAVFFKAMQQALKKQIGGDKTAIEKAMAEMKKNAKPTITIPTSVVTNFVQYLNKGEKLATVLKSISYDKNSGSKHYDLSDFEKERKLTVKGLDSYTTLIHELGHAFGLADQYTSKNADPNYSSDNNPGNSIMNADSEFWPSCDDITGMLLLFDRVSGHTRAMSTLCKSQEQGLYISGKREGTWIVKEGDPSFSQTCVGKYSNGKRHGEWTCFYEEPDFNKEIKHVINYKYGVQVGTSEAHYVDSGKLYTTGEFVNGKLKSIRKLYDPEGKVFKTQQDIVYDGRSLYTEKRFFDYEKGKVKMIVAYDDAEHLSLFCEVGVNGKATTQGYQYQPGADRYPETFVAEFKADGSFLQATGYDEKGSLLTIDNVDDISITILRVLYPFDDALNVPACETAFRYLCSRTAVVSPLSQ